jgi:PadR family transcriptional regulator PadR
MVSLSGRIDSRRQRPLAIASASKRQRGYVVFGPPELPLIVQCTGASGRLCFRTVRPAYRLTTCRSSIYGGVMEFRTPSYFALASLIDGPLHGYAMVRRAAELSDGVVRLSTGTLYALLERAIDEGLIVAGEPYIEGGRQRRDYSLTQDGRHELQAEAERLARAARTVTRRLRVTASAVAE